MVKWLQKKDGEEKFRIKVKSFLYSCNIIIYIIMTESSDWSLNRLIDS